MKFLEVAVLGAGSRGRHAYGSYVLDNQDKIRYVAVIEPDSEKRKATALEHSISSEMQFENEEDFFERGKICDALIIAHQDNQHHKTTLRALEIGYDVLVEKPMATSAKECIEMHEASVKYQRSLTVCHVLRYTPFFETLKKIIDSGEIGDVIGIDHTENIGHYHMGHSFVRGNWRNSKESAPIILAKTCHDLDILSWLINSECVDVVSRGQLNYFKKDNAPKNSAERCFDCDLENDCIFSGKNVYLGSTIKTWPTNVLTANPTIESVTEELNKSNYGKCVWKIDDNDVCDHQVAILKFENGVNVTFTVTAFTNNQYRETRIFGTKGSIYANTNKNVIEVKKFGVNETHEQKVVSITPNTLNGGHGGGDTGLMSDFTRAITDKNSVAKTSSSHSLQSHIMAFAIEKSRLENKIVNIREFYEEELNDK